MKAKYIDKTFPITLQDLIDLAKSENLDPKDLKLIMNSNQADLSAYVQCALLNQDCDKISIELYIEANDGLHEDISLKTKPKSPLKQNKNTSSSNPSISNHRRDPGSILRSRYSISLRYRYTKPNRGI